MPSDLREHDLRAFLEHMAAEMPTPADVPSGAIRRARTRLAGTAVGTALAVAIAFAGAVGGVRALLHAEPNRPARDDQQPTVPADWQTFDSPSYGYSISIPPDWTVEPTTIQWAWGEPRRSDVVQARGQDSPTSGFSFNILIASIAIPEGMSDAGWQRGEEAAFQEVTAGTCQSPPKIEPIEIDGVSGRLAAACNYQGWEGAGDRGTMSMTFVAQRRGYVISTAGTASLHMELLLSVLATIDFRPELAIVPPADVAAWRGVWPQTTRAEAERAQEQADAEGVETYWQSDWNHNGIVARRYLEQVLGWQVLPTGESYVPSDSAQDWEVEVWERSFIRCEPDAINPLYPDDPRGGDCAPTIDDTHYQQVVVRLEQLIVQGRGGIWFVTGWEEVEPYVQTVPPSASERADALRRLEAFMRARVAGSGAERFLETSDASVSYLYSMEDGRPYGAFEIQPGRDWERPEWPFAGFGDLLVRLTPSSGDGCVIQVIRTRSAGSDGEGDLIFSQFTGFSGFEGAFEPGSPECGAPLDESLLPPDTVVR
jgi:hypothetical protein